MKNPYLSAAAASAYICAFALFIIARQPPIEHTVVPILVPVVMLSLLVLSVSVMAFLFFYQPLVLILDGKREEALHYFAHMVGTFAAVTAVILAAALSL